IAAIEVVPSTTMISGTRIHQATPCPQAISGGVASARTRATIPAETASSKLFGMSISPRWAELRHLRRSTPTTGAYALTLGAYSPVLVQYLSLEAERRSGAKPAKPVLG